MEFETISLSQFIETIEYLKINDLEFEAEYFIYAEKDRNNIYTALKNIL